MKTIGTYAVRFPIDPEGESMRLDELRAEALAGFHEELDAANLTMSSKPLVEVSHRHREIRISATVQRRKTR